MSIYQYYSPRSPLPEDRGMSGLELNLEQKIRILESAERSYDGAVTAFAIQQQTSDMADNRRSSIRRKRKITCTGCTKKWCNECCLASANKRLREAGDLVEEIKSDIEAIKRRMVPQQTRQVIPPCPVPAFVDSDEEDSNNENNSTDEVKQETDVKQEPEDSFVSFQFTPSMGMINTVKSEPMDPHQNQTTEDSDTSNATSNESSNGTIQEESTLRSEQSYRDYPSTPERSDYTTSEEDTDNESEEENEDRRPIRSILNLLNE